MNSRNRTQRTGNKSFSNVLDRLQIHYLPVVQLKPDPQNPRLHSPKQVRQIAESIKAFGFNVPVLVDAQNRVIAGHGRLQACKLLGIDQVPTISLQGLSQAQIRAFVIADNRLTENSEWNEVLLAEQFKILSEAEIEFSLEATGFEIGEIDVMIDGLSPASIGENDPADELPELNKTRVSLPGDLWQLGKHRILCGDATLSASYRSVLGGTKAAAVFIDPPYNDPIDGYVTGFGKIHHPEFAVASGEMTDAEFTAFLIKVFHLLAANSVNGALHFICMDWRHTPNLLAAARQAYADFMNLCVWIKESGGQGSLYRSQHELVFVFKGGKGPHRNNVQLGQYGRYRTNVWQYRRVNSLGRGSGEGNLAASHPTIKPVELVADAILDCTSRGEIVLDAFLGSGTTLIAAERTGRICYGIEIDTVYVDTIVRRWQAFTGKAAVNEETGQSFDEKEEEVRHEEG